MIKDFDSGKMTTGCFDLLYSPLPLLAEESRIRDDCTVGFWNTLPDQAANLGDEVIINMYVYSDI